MKVRIVYVDGRIKKGTIRYLPTPSERDGFWFLPMGEENQRFNPFNTIKEIVIEEIE